MRIFRACLSVWARAAGFTLLLSAAALANSPAIPATQVPTALRDIGIDQNLNQQVPLNLAFKDEAGKSVLLSDYMGKKPAILVLAYYECPRLCTLVLNGVGNAAKLMGLKLGTDYNVITVSINPKETPELAAGKKASYMKLLGSDANPEGWHFLTGTQDSITRLAQAVGFKYKYEKDTGQYSHASGIMVMTPQGKLSHYFYGIEFPAKDLRLSLVAASNGKIGSAVDQVLLFCCSFDPATGKYNLVIFRVVQVICSSLAIGLALFLLLMFTADRWMFRRTRVSS